MIKKEKSVFRLVLYIIFFSYLAMIIFNLLITDDNDQNIKLADGFTIEAYNVILDVNEDNKIDVTEEITVDFMYGNKHGIYKFTPKWLEYTGQDSKTIKRKSNVLNYRAIGDPYSLDTVKKKARIKIGSASEYVDAGEKTYTIKYTYDMGKDPFKNFDELIFHAYGDYWGTEIKNATIEVNMPKNIDGYKVNFFTDKYRNNNVNDVVDYTIKGKTLKATFNAEKNYTKQLNEYCNETHHQTIDGRCNYDSFKYSYQPLESSLTLDIELPEGYFVGGSWNYGWGSFTLILIIFLLTGITIYKWYRYGKDYQKKAQTVEFYPPEDLSAAEVGFIYGKQTNKKLTVSLIVELASKGYIKIDELKDKEKNIQITNIAIKPLELRSSNDPLPERIIKIKKLKEADTNLTKPEKTMMAYLFKQGEIKFLETNINKFLEVKDKLVNSGYIKILSDNDLSKINNIGERKKLYEEQANQYNLDVAGYNEIKGLKPLTSIEKIVYDRLFDSQDIVILSKHTTFYKAFNDVENAIISNLKDKVHDAKATKQIKGTIIRTILILIIGLISYKFVEDLDPKWGILYFLSFFSVIINLFFIFIMKRKTKYGEEITARVKGFRHFLITAEKPMLESLVAKNPTYFYNILPYTYVLNISKKWIKKFENIPVPEMDMGNFNFSSDSSYYSLYDNVYYPEPIHYSSGSNSSSGCSSCGGGCSSCGGGCSSCGGGGSW